MHTTLMTFPCDFDLKIIGKNTASFVKDILTIAQKFYPETTEKSIRIQESKKSNYIALNLTIHALEQNTLDALYSALTQHSDVHMVL